MRKVLPISLTALCLAVYADSAEIPVSDLARFELRNAHASAATLKGQTALKLTGEKITNNAYATLRNVTFHDGTIDVDVAGSLAKEAGAEARGFIGVSFRVQAGGAKMETIYIRPTNGRAQDQLRRNHSVQYVAEPEWHWERLRKETPGVYESYADMLEGEWIHLRIVVSGRDASLYVGGAAQPCLLVHDLKLGDSSGGVALWIGPGTEGYFRNLRITDSGK